MACSSSSIGRLGRAGMRKEAALVEERQEGAYLRTCVNGLTALQ